jgi:hypothetical protein
MSPGKRALEPPYEVQGVDSPPIFVVPEWEWDSTQPTLFGNPYHHFAGEQALEVRFANGWSGDFAWDIDPDITATAPMRRVVIGWTFVLHPDYNARTDRLTWWSAARREGAQMWLDSDDAATLDAVATLIRDAMKRGPWRPSEPLRISSLPPADGSASRADRP